ncbi:MAG TPA: hypothetical protein VIG99_02630 [Myxococcaceae bacterium]|jgi:hypothetical protein
MKVQSQPAAPQTAAATGTTATAKTNPAGAATAAAKPAAAAGAAPANAGQLTDRFKDGFESGKMQPGNKGIIDCFPNWPPVKKDTMGLGDHLTAGQLSETLSNPLDKPLLESGNKDQKLTRDDNGVMRGPDGQPLAKVDLKDGNTAYVDPNTNQYYLTDERDWLGQGVNALGPLPLPEGAQFSNSYFSDADVRSIERDARGGGLFPPFPHKPVDPLPRFPRDPWGPIMPANPVLLGANGVKGSNLE